MPRFKEIKNINIVILEKTINEEITRSDIEELLGINYGEEVRLRILDESNTFLRLDFVLDVDKNAVSCNPLKCVKIWGCRQRVNLCIQYGKNLTQDWLVLEVRFFLHAHAVRIRKRQRLSHLHRRISGSPLPNYAMSRQAGSLLMLKRKRLAAQG